MPNCYPRYTTIYIMFKKINIPIASASLYVACQLIANILSTKIALLPWIHLSVDGGTIIYPLSFTVRDFVHKSCGKRVARQVVIIAAALNVLMVLLFWLIGKMEPDPTWAFQAAYESVLMPVWRITAASIIAQIISELVDTEIFSLVYKKIGDMLGVLFSNSVALVIDSVIFCGIAFIGNLPMITVWQIIITNIIIKFIITLISIPTIKLIPETATKADI
ncbi:MAG: hypothetical protein ACD_43C00143G0001 [uncultured bacterium]|nr:MAG: hypothetical protein ACD_43C00143G0001 [uncultured bacterium]